MPRTIFSVLAVFLFSASVSAAADKEAYLHFMNGMVQERRGNYDSALQEYKRTLLLDPESVFVYKQALNLALRIGKVDEAGRWADFVVRADSATADNWVLYGNVRWAAGDMPGAAASYEKAFLLDASNHEALYQLASLWSGRNPDRSIDYLKKYLEVKPEDAAEVYYQIAVLHNAKGRHEDMKRSLIKAKEADAYYPQPRYMLANYYEVKNDTAAALGEYRELLDLEPNNAELYNHLGELYASPAVGDLEAAEKYFLKAWELNKADPAACFWLSVISEQRRDFAAAAAYIEGSSALKDDAALALRLAYYYTQSDRYAKAIALLEGAAKKWPDNGEITYFLALGYDDTGDPKKARTLLRQLLAKNPDNAEARMQYAVISERENDMAAAEENFRYLLAANPANANVLNYLGYSLADRGLKLAEAQVLISSAVALEPANGAYLDSLAWVRFRNGDVPGALEGIKKALKAVYDDAVVWGHAGEIYEASGDYRTAWLAWKNSRLLEKPAKRANADARIKALQKRIPDAEAEGLKRAWLAAFLPAGQEFSSFAKIEARLRGRTVKLDAILHFAPPSDFSLTVMGPLMAPLWRARFSGGSLEMDSMELKDIDAGAFNYWASLVTAELRDWFSGRTLAGGRLDGGWGGDCFTGGGREVCLDADGTPARIRPESERKLAFEPSHYFFRNLYLFPYVMEFKLPHVALKVTMDYGQMNFSGVNTLKLPD
ncbi:MAG: tetratricopeptide repeat protein [Elusimicrobiales bacterium]|nr:tetratricopeptide repeat protein [Elusimicrobiales bacterium]